MITHTTVDSSIALFEIKLELHDNLLVFSPTLLETAENGFLELIFGLMQDICAVADLIPKIAHGMNDNLTYIQFHSNSLLFL